jgi:hypothetical protein
MTAKAGIFSKYRNAIFVETGSYLGDGIQKAIDEGFNRIISIELADKYYEHCRQRFAHDMRISIVQGDSFKVLPNILKCIDQPTTFWLDGHHSCDDTGLGEYWAPLMKELDVIKDHHIKEHTILIDDMRCWEEPNPVHGFFKDDIYKKLKEINQNYAYSLEDGHVEKDILAAYILR